MGSPTVPDTVNAHRDDSETDDEPVEAASPSSEPKAVTTVALDPQLVKGRDTPVVSFRLVEEPGPTTVMAPSERL